MHSLRLVGHARGSQTERALLLARSGFARDVPAGASSWIALLPTSVGKCEPFSPLHSPTDEAEHYPVEDGQTKDNYRTPGCFHPRTQDH